MMIREYRDEDYNEIARIHRAQGFEFELPELPTFKDPLWFIKLVGEEDGKIVNAAFAHLTAEIYGFIDPDAGTPKQKLDNLITLHDAGCNYAYRTGGLSDIHAWLPPQISKSFGRRLMKLGWKKPLWTSYAKDLKG